MGQVEIDLAEKEMPGLMALRSENGKSQPLKGARISGSIHMTIQTAVLVKPCKRWEPKCAVIMQHFLYPGQAAAAWPPMAHRFCLERRNRRRVIGGALNRR